MSDSARLLQMLEPSVRPVAAPGPVRPPTRVPFEQRGFDDLLAEFGAANNTATPQSNPTGTPVAAKTEQTRTERPPSPLMDLGRVENASLRLLIAQRAAPTAQNLPAA